MGKAQSNWQSKELLRMTGLQLWLCAHYSDEGSLAVDYTRLL